MTELQPNQVATVPIKIDNVNLLVGMLASKVRMSLADNGPTVESILEWLKGQDMPTIRKSIIETQPKAWAVAIEPLVKSMSDEQCVGFLAALLGVFVQVPRGGE